MKRHTSARRESEPANHAFENRRNIPLLYTPHEVADLLRTSRIAIYAMAARGQIPGMIRIGRRLLFRTDALLDWLDQKRAPSPRE